MGDQNFVLIFVKACTSGKLEFSECEPVWHLFIIAAFLVLAVAALLVLRIRHRAQSE